MKKYRLVAPDVDELLLYFEREYLNPSVPTKAVCAAMEPVFETLRDLAPSKENSEAKAIWIMVPRGTIDDFVSYEELLEWGEVKDRDEYEKRWHEEYPDPVSWYRLILFESLDKGGTLRYRGIVFGERFIVSARMQQEESEGIGYADYREEAVTAICSLLAAAAGESMEKLRSGTYNNTVRTSLPYQFRTGVIRRSTVWEREPGWKDDDLEGLTEETIQAFQKRLASGLNDSSRISRLKSMTANDFFRACATGYHACGYKGTDLPLIEQYLLHADGRDEGLSGRGYDLDADPGIDFDDPAAWDQWYFYRKQHGGHPWEICRGGNSTHVDLFVMHDRNKLDFQFRLGEIPENEYERKSKEAGYYFEVAGKHRGAEAVQFYLALAAAGFPVILADAEEILSRFTGTGYVGIVPHSVIPKYCESMFPSKYGKVIDFIHMYEEEMESFGDAVEWISEKEAELLAAGNEAGTEEDCKEDDSK